MNKQIYKETNKCTKCKIIHGIHIHAFLHTNQGTHKEAYDAVYKSTRSIFHTLLSAGEDALLREYASVLECLLRLRQVSGTMLRG